MFILKIRQYLVIACINITAECAWRQANSFELFNIERVWIVTEYIYLRPMVIIYARQLMCQMLPLLGN